MQQPKERISKSERTRLVLAQRVLARELEDLKADIDAAFKILHSRIDGASQWAEKNEARITEVMNEHRALALSSERAEQGIIVVLGRRIEQLEAAVEKHAIRTESLENLQNALLHEFSASLVRTNAILHAGFWDRLRWLLFGLPQSSHWNEAAAPDGAYDALLEKITS